MTYQILNWDKNFENDRSRRVEQCRFVCVPNKQHGMGFVRIMTEPDGAAIYGIWHCILGACSQQKKRNGWLTTNGEKDGSAWGVDDLAIKFRRPENEIQRALEVLSSEKVGWIVTTDSPPSHHEITPEYVEGKGKKEGKEKKEGNGNPPPIATQRWQIQQDIDRLKARIKEIRVESGQEFDGTRWHGVLPPDKKQTVEKLKGELNALKTRFDNAPS